MKVTHIRTCRFHFPAGVWIFSDSLKVQSVRTPRWQSPFFICLDWRFCSLLKLLPPQFVCKLSRHKWGRPHLKTIRPPKVPLTELCYALHTNHQGNFKSRLIFWGDLLLPVRQEVGVPFSTGGSTSGSSSCRKAWIRKSRCMNAPWLVGDLILHPHPFREACLLKQLILGCFGGHVSLQVHHSLIFHAISPIHTQCLTGTERQTCCDGSEPVKREEPIGCFHHWERCTDNSDSGNLNRSVKLICYTHSTSSVTENWDFLNAHSKCSTHTVPGKLQGFNLQDADIQEYI